MPRFDPARPRLEVATKSSIRKPTASEVARALTAFQDMFWLVGEEVARLGSREKGSFPKPVLDNYTLEVTKVKTGSVIAEFRIGATTQTVIEGDTRHLNEAVAKIEKFLDIINDPKSKPKDLDAVSSNPHRRRRLLSAADRLVPQDEVVKVTAKISTKSREIPIKSRVTIERLLDAEPREETLELQGFIVQVRVDKRRVLLIDTAEGERRLQYSRDLEADVRDLLGRLAHVRASKPEAKGLPEITDSDHLKPLASLPISSFVVGGLTKTFSPPINFKFEVDGDEYLATHDDLQIVARATDMRKLVHEIESTLAGLWEVYVESPEDELTSDAIDLRNTLKMLVGAF
jgi:hypothetical protein